MTTKYAVTNGDHTIDVVQTSAEAWRLVATIARDLSFHGTSIVGYGFTSESTRLGLVTLDARNGDVELGVVPVEIDE